MSFYVPETFKMDNSERQKAFRKALMSFAVNADVDDAVIEFIIEMLATTPPDAKDYESTVAPFIPRYNKMPAKLKHRFCTKLISIMHPGHVNTDSPVTSTASETPTGSEGMTPVPEPSSSPEPPTKPDLTSFWGELSSTFGIDASSAAKPSGRAKGQTAITVQPRLASSQAEAIRQVRAVLPHVGEADAAAALADAGGVVDDAVLALLSSNAEPFALVTRPGAGAGKGGDYTKGGVLRHPRTSDTASAAEVAKKRAANHAAWQRLADKDTETLTAAPASAPAPAPSNGVDGRASSSSPPLPPANAAAVDLAFWSSDSGRPTDSRRPGFAARRAASEPAKYMDIGKLAESALDKQQQQQQHQRAAAMSIRPTTAAQAATTMPLPLDAPLAWPSDKEIAAARASDATPSPLARPSPAAPAGLATAAVAGGSTESDDTEDGATVPPRLQPVVDRLRAVLPDLGEEAALFALSRHGFDGDAAAEHVLSCGADAVAAELEAARAAAEAAAGQERAALKARALARYDEQVRQCISQ